MESQYPIPIQPDTNMTASRTENADINTLVFAPLHPKIYSTVSGYGPNLELVCSDKRLAKGCVALDSPRHLVAPCNTIRVLQDQRANLDARRMTRMGVAFGSCNGLIGADRSRYELRDDTG